MKPIELSVSRPLPDQAPARSRDPRNPSGLEPGRIMSEPRPDSMTEGPPRPRPLNAALGKPLGVAVLWLHRWMWRRELAALTIEQLHDVGLDPVQVRRESEKMFWQA